MDSLEPTLPHYIGHRARLKQRLVNASSELADYELLENLLFFAIPRKDVKPLAKQLLKDFKDLNNLVNADKEKLLATQGANDSIHIILCLIKELNNRMLKQKISDQNIISSWAALLDYLKSVMGYVKVEQFRILFLNKKNVLIADEVIATGTIDQTPIYPREIIKRVLYHEAGAIILVHNHPSGNCKPSKADIELTAKIVEACKIVSVSVHDHIIISNRDYYSFKTNMLL